MKKKLTIILFTLIVIVLLGENLFAIPAFARKYSMSCQTCHSPAPRLKAYGEEFAGNAFQLTDKEAPRYYMETGDDELSLIRDIPLAFRLDGYITYNHKQSKASDISSPYYLKIMSGGSLSSKAAYYFYFYFSERGEIAGVEDAFIMFNDLFGTDLDVYIGQFAVSDPLFKGELRLTFDNYQIYKTNVGLSKVNLSYDRGIMLTYGLETGTDITLELVNGNGIGKANNFKIFDDDAYKNFLGRISQDIVDNIRIGVFGYTGKEELVSGIQQFENSVTMFGPDFTFGYKDILELNGQYLFRKDKDPIGTAQEIKTKGAFVELIYTPNGDNSKWYANGLFNWIESDQISLNHKSATAHVGYIFRRNIRMIAEYTYNLTNKYGQVVVGVSSAF